MRGLFAASPVLLPNTGGASIAGQVAFGTKGDSLKRKTRTLCSPRGGIIAALAFAGFAGSASGLDLSGASTIQPLIDKVAPIHTKASGEPVTVVGGGSGAGIKNTLAGTSQIGMVSRALSDAEKADLRFATIGLDALAIIVNKSNKLEALSKAQLVDLYTGKIDNWKDLGGSERPVVRISKEVGRSTLELFEHYTGLISPDRKKTDKPLINSNAYIVGSNLEAATLVGSIPGSIGYVSVGTALTLAKAGMPIKVLTLDAVEPTEETIRSKRYPIVRELNLVYLKETPAITAFLATVIGTEGQAIVKAQGFLPVGK